MVGFEAMTCGIAFKEWAEVCEALVDGRQTILIRKGGIAESRGAGCFEPKYSEFWLYPTWVHQAEQGVRPGVLPQPMARRAPGDLAVSIRGLVRIDTIAEVTSERALGALAEFHVLTAETVSKRFHYRQPGVWVLGARVWRHDRGFRVNPTPEHAGCKTWVELDQAYPTVDLTPAFADDAWAQVQSRLHTALGRQP
jgi:hypothetical protein